MPFPISLIGSFNVETPAAPDQYVLNLKTAIADWLVEKRARTVSQTAQGISFTAGLFRKVSGGNPLGPFGSGKIEVIRRETTIRVTYRLRYTEFLIVVTSLVVLFFGPPLLYAPNLNAIEAIGLMILAWIWLFGLNYVISRYRVPNALKRIARQTTGGKVS